MTTADQTPSAAPSKLTENLARIETLAQRLVQALAAKKPGDASLQAPGPELMMKAGAAWWADAMANPAKLIEAQAALWGKSLQTYVDAQKAMAAGTVTAPAEGAPKDRRFANPLWDNNPYFNLIKQQYLLQAEAVTASVAALEHVDPADRQRIGFFARQIVDMLAPTNFLATNPDALERAVASEGESLVRGLENLVHDIEANKGELLVTLADRDAFKVGGNIGTSPGAVVARNRMFELIQYTAVTELVHATPLLIFPPWINKFYILDLKPQNSMVKWLTEQGFTLFVVSWKNPDPSYADVGLDSYAEEGYLEAIKAVKAITGQPEVNAVGYCIAGTILSAVLALMKKRGDTSVHSATFFTTLTDFSDRGEVGVFLEDDFVDAIVAEIGASGILKSVFMTRTFSYLRANDLIYGPAIRSYMLGEAPPAFDLLYWNGDSTNLPGRMAVEYLRRLCQSDELAQGAFELCGERVTLKDVTLPVCAIACETDHIAAWRSSFNGIARFGSKDRTFILSQSGHVAGIVNPPGKDKYGHYSSDAALIDPDGWKAGADFTKGSWWPRWGKWLAERSGEMVPAGDLGDKKHPILAPAPGTYVLESPNT